MYLYSGTIQTDTTKVEFADGSIKDFTQDVGGPAAAVAAAEGLFAFDPIGGGPPIYLGVIADV